MMITNATITIYNREYDPLTRFDTGHRTVIRDAVNSQEVACEYWTVISGVVKEI